MENFTLLRKKIFPFIFRAIAIFLSIIIMMELIAQTSWVQRVIPYRSVGNFHYQFEIKWFKLDRFVKQNRGVDVIILGSSLVNTGIDPDVMAQVFYERTRRRIRIFNFGIEMSAGDM